MHIKRETYLAELVDRMHNGMVKVITGIRRCGKTYLLFEIFDKYLHEAGVRDEQVVKVALDDERNISLRNPAALADYLDTELAKAKGQRYVLLDEIQYAISDEEFRLKKPPRIYGVLNGLLRRSDVDVYVTGSNSKMLSTDVMTEFRGRGDEVSVRPLSFREFMEGFEGDMYQGLAEYMTYGGMPLLLSMKTDVQKARYLERLFSETYLKDMVERNGIRKTRELDELVDVIASNIGCLTSMGKIESTFKSRLRSEISYNTISSYVEDMKEAFLIEEAKRYDVKGRKYIGGSAKYYFEDVGLRNARLGFRQVEPTHIMENVIFNELRTRGFSVDVGVVDMRVSGKGESQRRRLETDFVANLGSNRYYIQSAYSIPSRQKEDQEKESLRSIGDSFKKIVVVHDVVKPMRDESGITTMSIYDFLTNPDSLLL